MDIPFGEDKVPLRMAWELARSGVKERMGFSSIILAERYAWAVDRAEGLRGCSRILPRIRRQEDSWTLAFALTELGTLHRLHNLDEAQACLTEALALHRQAGTYDAWSSTLRALSRVIHRAGIV